MPTILRYAKLLPGILLPVLIGLSAIAQPYQDDLNLPGLKQRIDSMLTAAEQQGFSGTILLLSADDVLLNKGYGYSDCRNKKTRTGLLYDMGSITKSITGAAILRLVQNQKLGLQSKVKDLVPGWPEDKAGITIVHLLMHQSGLKEDLGLDETYISRDSLMQKIKASTLLFQPGEKTQYSNAGFSLLGYIIETVSGKDYEAYLQQEFFRPLNMKHTGYTVSRKEKLACGMLKQKQWGTVTDYYGPDGPSWYLKANGGMLTTTTDLQRFFDALLKSELLPREQKDLMIAAMTRKTKQGNRIIRSSGANNIFSSAYCHWLDHNLGFVLFTNNSAFPKERIEPAIIGAIDLALDRN
ncbi:MAG TPA: serine hydrolase domain-containing protein [Chitinophagaceae bacterium]|nr:serine hydrolase domain-containing protein [Chitinophagaceae bacterium]